MSMTGLAEQYGQMQNNVGIERRWTLAQDAKLTLQYIFEKKTDK